MAKKNNVRLIGTSIASGDSKNYAALPVKVKDKQINYTNEEKEALAKVILETNASGYDFFENEEFVTVEEPTLENVADVEAIEEPVVTEESIEEVIEEPVVTEEAIEEVIEEPVVTEEAIEEVIEEPVVTEEAIEEAIEEPVVTEEAIEEAIEEPVVTEEAIEETIEEPVVTEESIEEAIEEPVVTEEAIEEAIEEPVATEEITEEAQQTQQYTPVSASRGSYTVTDDKGLVHLKRKKKGLSLTTKKALSGWIFVLPFLIGIIFIYAPIIVDSITFSFSDNSSIMSGEGLENVGFDNYKELFNPTDPEVKGKEFTTSLIHGFRDLVIQIPAIVIFALFMAIILNQNMKGRGFFRAIFFLPVILGAGIIDQLQDASKFLTQAEGATGSGMDGGTGEETAGIVSSLDVEMLLSNIKLGTDLVDIVTMLINSIFDIVSRSGVQMLIFLSGLQSISPAIYESCQVEGATAWETFWKITLPMISPMILVNAVYTIIDMFTAADNRVMKSISDMISGSGMSSMKPGLASAMGWTYIGVILVVIVLIAILMKSIVFYQRRD